MARKGKKDQDGGRRIPKLGSLLIEENEDDAELFLRSLEKLDPQTIKQKLQSESTGSATHKRTAGSTPNDDRYELDLHRCSLEDAKRAIDEMIASIFADGRKGSEAKLLVITGKGRHSGAKGSVLAREAHAYLSRRYAKHITSIEEAPADLVVGELPVRGHFRVLLRR